MIVTLVITGLVCLVAGVWIGVRFANAYRWQTDIVASWERDCNVNDAADMATDCEQ